MRASWWGKGGDHSVHRVNVSGLHLHSCSVQLVAWVPKDPFFNRLCRHR